jgi:hypothetical protein
MPRVYRTMKKDPDGRPKEEPTPKGLGVRPTDITVDEDGYVVLDGNGMSVAPGWRVLQLYRIPSRLRGIVQGARGPDDTFCFAMGDGPFKRGVLASGLELIPDTATHGSLAPSEVVPLAQYQADISATRAAWEEDET